LILPIKSYSRPRVEQLTSGCQVPQETLSTDDPALAQIIAGVAEPTRADSPGDAEFDRLMADQHGQLPTQIAVSLGSILGKPAAASVVGWPSV